MGYYLRYNLSYREVQDLLYDRGINVSHTTIYRWVQEYGKLLYQNGFYQGTEHRTIKYLNNLIEQEDPPILAAQEGLLLNLIFQNVEK